MIGSLKLAWRYILFHKLKTLILIACIFLASFLPIAVHILLSQFDQKIVARATSTPTVVGAKGSSLELALTALYFQDKKTDTIPFKHAQTINEEGWGQAIPLYCAHSATGTIKSDQPILNPVVGTSLDYFSFRGLQVAEGQLLTVLGDCVLGADVAERLQLSPGDRLATDTENILDISGSYPLNMLVRGVLQKSSTPDDKAVFVDLKTAWVIDDLGHGHQSAETLEQGSRLATDGNKIITNAAVSTYTQIDESNLESFHFHGDVSDFPISAIIGIANSTKNETLMLAYFQTDVENAQIILPIAVVKDLMAMVFQVEKFFRAGALLIATSTLLLLFLVLALSLRLRKQEMQTMFKLGCSRSAIAMMQFWELAFVFSMAAILVVVAIWAVSNIAGDLVQYLLLGN